MFIVKLINLFISFLNNLILLIILKVILATIANQNYKGYLRI